MSEITDLTDYKKNQNIILNKGKDYYKNNKREIKKSGKR